MPDTTSSNLNIKNLILMPVVISIVVTLVRLVGELMEGPSILFGRQAGGGFALVGITWLIPVFGAYFAVKLIRTGYLPEGNWKLVLLSLVSAVVASFIIGAGSFAIGFLSPFAATVAVVGAVLGMWLPRLVWPELFRTLLAYALAVRIPVAILMLVAIFAGWGTHYDVVPPGFPEGVSPFATWVVIGAVPQLTFWLMFTVTIGSLFGGIAAVAMHAKPTEEARAT